MKKILIGIAIFIVLLLGGYSVLHLVYPSLFRNYLTVEEVWKNAKGYDGKIIRIQGKAEFSTMMTLVLCIPSRCDCNETTGQLRLVNEPISHVNAKYAVNDYIWVSDLDCHGDECGMTCPVIQPKTGDVYEFVGRLAVTFENADPAELQLTEIDISSSRQLVNGAWVPIPTGPFVKELRATSNP